jgi:hypothetical protein
MKEKLVHIVCALIGSVSVIAEEFYMDFLMDGFTMRAAVIHFHVVELLVGFGSEFRAGVRHRIVPANSCRSSMRLDCGNIIG